MAGFAGRLAVMVATGVISTVAGSVGGPARAIVSGHDLAAARLSDICVSGFGGRYQLAGLAASRYRFQFHLYCDGSPGVRAGKTVSASNADPSPGAVMSGKVTDVLGHPIGSICVLVGDGSETETNPDGTYSVTGIEPGSWGVQFSGGCGNRGSYAPLFYDNQPNGQLASVIRFQAGKTVPNVDAVMQPGGTITGVVTSASGHSLSNVCVGAATEAQAGLGEVFTDITFTSNGHYLMRNLAPSPYLIQFGCSGGRYASRWFGSQPDSSAGELVSVNSGVTTVASAMLRTAGNIAGVVTDRQGRPLSGICVTVADAGDKAFVNLPGGPVVTGKTGRYVAGGLAPGRYLLQFVDCHPRVRYGSQWYRDKTTVTFATLVDVRSGRRERGIDARLGIGGQISGVVRGSSGRPLQGVCVEASDAGAQASGLATTTRSGRYQITGLSSGRYLVSFSGCSPGTQYLASVSRPGLVRVVAPRTVTGVGMRLRPGGSISGTVTTAAAPGSPLSETCVLVAPVNPDGSFGFGFTGPGGGYVVGSLAPGTYHVYFGDPSCQFFDVGLFLAPQWFSGQLTQATGTSIKVTAGHATRKVSAALRPYGGITGTVTDQAHAGVSGECVTAVPFKDPPDEFTGLPVAPEIAISASGEGYTLADLAPGGYQVEFSAGCGDSGFATQWWNGVLSPTSATVINVGFTAIGQIDAQLQP